MDEQVDSMIDAHIAVLIVVLIVICCGLIVGIWTRWSIDQSADRPPATSSELDDRPHFVKRVRSLVVSASLICITITLAIALTAGAWRASLSLIAILALGGVIMPLAPVKMNGSPRSRRDELTITCACVGGLIIAQSVIFFV